MYIRVNLLSVLQGFYSGRKRNNIAVYFLITVFLLIAWCAESTVASGKQYINADAQFAYAENCFGDKDYMTAVVEYRRFIYFFPGDKRVDMASHQIGMAYFQAGQFKQAITVFKQNIETLKKMDIHITGPEIGRLACGTEGPGRMTEPADIIEKLTQII